VADDCAAAALPAAAAAAAAGRPLDEKAKVPYRVRLDDGAIVLVHRDEHWLIREPGALSP
jgi:hypothetical protein